MIGPHEGMERSENWTLATRYRRDFFGSPKDATRIKLRIIENYLKPWAAKLGSARSGGRIWIVDGFAGKGAFDDGTPGSPKLILEAARSVLEAKRKYRIGCLFVEKDARNSPALN